MYSVMALETYTDIPTVVAKQNENIDGKINVLEIGSHTQTAVKHGSTDRHMQICRQRDKHM